MYRWYQCDIVMKNGKKYPWCRFIAKSMTDAEEKLNNRVADSLYGSFRKAFFRFLGKKVISDFIVTEVPDEILGRYDLNNSKDVEMFYERVRG